MQLQPTFGRSGWAGWAIVVVLLILVPAACHYSQAEEMPRLTAKACASLVSIVKTAAAARDEGARGDSFLQRTTAYYEAFGVRGPMRDLALREIQRVFDSPGVTAAALELDVNNRCMAGAIGALEV